MTSAVKPKMPKTGPAMASAVKPMMKTVAQPISIMNKKSIYLYTFQIFSAYTSNNIRRILNAFSPSRYDSCVMSVGQ